MARRIKYLANGTISEQSMQCAIIDWVRYHPIILKHIMHIPNESKSTPGYRKTLSDMGVKSGVSDLFVALPRRGYHGAWIELKSQNGRLGPAQKVFLEDMAIAGYFTKVCYTIEEAIETLTFYCLTPE